MLKDKNVDKMMFVLVMVIIVYDLEFWKELLYLFLYEDWRLFLVGKVEYLEVIVFCNGIF